jgi:hypothetical protein
VASGRPPAGLHRPARRAWLHAHGAACSSLGHGVARMSCTPTVDAPQPGNAFRSGWRPRRRQLQRPLERCPACRVPTLWRRERERAVARASARGARRCLRRQRADGMNRRQFRRSTRKPAAAAQADGMHRRAPSCWRLRSPAPAVPCRRCGPPRRRLRPNGRRTASGSCIAGTTAASRRARRRSSAANVAGTARRSAGRVPGGGPRRS